MSDIKRGFAPFVPSGAQVLILGSFPSVKSRSSEFYYGNPQNRFWRVLAEFFNEDTPISTSDKREFLTRHKIALWDMVSECEIEGSSDSSIKNYKVADVVNLLQNHKFGLIILNGGKARELFERYCHEADVPAVGLPSTSPANARFSKDEWFRALSRAFGRA